jgi:hypothetical protein
MLKSISNHIRDFASVISAAELNIHDIRISFDAPPKYAMETLTVNKKREFEANFQWLKYSLRLSNTDKSKWYVYMMNLEPWGTKQSGTEEVIASDETGALLKGEPIDVTPKKIEAMFPNLLKKPDLDPNFPEGMIEYINGNPKDKGKKYSPAEFRRIFEESKTEDGVNFYILITKSGEMKTPFGESKPPVGKAPVKGSCHEKRRH